MKKSQLEYYKKWFDGYVAGFYGPDEYVNANIRLKEDHTRYVCEEIRYLAEEVGLEGNEGRVAQCIALFHDVGRFPQFIKYGTYNDTRSESHSTWALEVLKDEKLLEPLERWEAEVIRKAIAFHGIKDLPEGLDERTLWSFPLQVGHKCPANQFAAAESEFLSQRIRFLQQPKRQRKSDPADARGSGHSCTSGKGKT